MKEVYKSIRIWTIWIIAIEVISIGLLFALYMFDHNKSNLTAMKEFAYILGDYYEDNAFEDIAEQDSISTMRKSIARYISNHVIEYNAFTNSIKTTQDAIDTYNMLQPDDIEECSLYVRSWIRCQAIQVVFCGLDIDADEYWQALATMYMKQQLYQPYLYDCMDEVLYNNVRSITLCLIFITILMFSVGIVRVFFYWKDYSIVNEELKKQLKDVKTQETENGD